MVFRLFLLISFIISLLLSADSISQSMPPTPVVVSNVIEKTYRKPLSFIGTVNPVRKSLISAEVEGIVESLNHKAGSYVKKGEVIARINNKKINLRLKEARNAEEELKATLMLAEDDLERAEALYKKGITSDRDLQDAAARRDSLLARDRLLNSRIEQLEYDLRKSKITAPFNGFITKDYTEVGQWLEEGGTVAELIDIDSVEIIVNMPEKYVNMIELDQSVFLQIYSIPDKDFTGKIISIVPYADELSRTFPVKVRVGNKDHIIKSSMSAKVFFNLGSEKTVKMVMKDAIVDNNGNKIIYVVRDGVAQPQVVIQGSAYGEYVEITSEVRVGEKVVIRGNERLQPMQPVSVTKEI